MEGLTGRRLAIAAALVVTCAVPLGVRLYPQERSRLALQAAAAWLPSEQRGELALVDGPSASVVATVPLARPGDVLVTAQRGLSAYVLDRSRRRLVRVDGTTQRTIATAASVADPKASLVASAAGVFLQAPQAGLVQRLDATTLQAAPETAVRTDSLSGAIETVTDAEGRPWGLSQSSGVLLRLTDGRRVAAGSPGPQRRTGSATGYRAAATRHVPALIDLARGTVRWADDDGDVLQVAVLPGSLGAGTVAVGDPASGRVALLDPQAPTPYVCHPAAAGCVAGEHLTGASTSWGTPVAAQGHTFLPDLGTGSVWILDDSGRIAARAAVFDRATRFELTERQGVVFFNEPAGHRAGVIDSDGRIRRIDKYEMVRAVADAPAPGPPPAPGTPTAPALPPGDAPSRPPASRTTEDTPAPAPPAATPPAATPPATTPPATTPPTSVPPPLVAPSSMPVPPATPTSVPPPASPTSQAPPSSGPVTTASGPSTTTATGRGPTASTTTVTTAATTTVTTTSARKTVSSGTIHGPAVVGSCAYFSGTADLADGATLILAKLNLDNGDPQEYVEYVFGWQAPQNLSSWSGPQYFANAEGQHLRVRLIAVDLDAAKAALGNDAAANALASGGQSLGSVTVTVAAGTGPGGGACTG